MPKRTSRADSHFDALFGARQGEQLAGGFKLIPRGSIERSAQPRQSFPAQEISELAASITALRERGEGIEGTGILQPLLVAQNDDGYRLVAGERRYRASEQAGIELLPAIVVEADESGVLLAQLVENLQRRDLPPLEEARGLDRLMNEQKLSLREAARVLGKGKGYLENRVNLLKMGADVQQMVSVQTDTLLHARDINPVPDLEVRAQLIRAVLEEGISRAELRRRIEGNESEEPQAKDTSHVSNPTDNNSISTNRTNGTTRRTSQEATGRETTGGDTATTPSDPLMSALRPAVAFAAEFSRQVQTLRMTREYQQEVEKELGLLKREVAAITKKLRDKSRS